MCFCLNYSEKSNYLETIPVSVKNFAYLFCIARKILECDKLYLLLTDEIQTDKKEYLQSLETPRDLSSLHRWTDTFIYKKLLSALTKKR